MGHVAHHLKSKCFKRRKPCKQFLPGASARNAPQWEAQNDNRIASIINSVNSLTGLGACRLHQHEKCNLASKALQEIGSTVSSKTCSTCNRINRKQKKSRQARKRTVDQQIKQSDMNLTLNSESSASNSEAYSPSSMQFSDILASTASRAES